MAFLNNQYITIDAVLTTKGRELLARNDGSFQITQFSLSDDEIDYTLYNPNHPSGSAYYGEAIELMPLLEAFVDKTQDMKYQLVTLPRGTSKLPVLSIPQGTISLTQGAQVTISPQTLNYLGASTATVEPSGYTAILGDSRVCASFVGVGVDTTNIDITSIVPVTSGVALSSAQVGTSFTFVAGTANDSLFPGGSSAVAGTQYTTTVTFIGRDSGARITIPFVLKKK